MNNRLKQIGISQHIRLEWVEMTANMVLAGNGKKAIHNTLEEYFKNKLSVGGTAKGCSREKVITILMKIWVNVPVVMSDFRDRGLDLLKTLPGDIHIAVHWGMVMAAYPFWGTVAETTGRLLRLQDTVSASQVQRRIRELYGERETAFNAARRVLRTFVDCGVLEDTAEKGVYRQRSKKTLKDVQLIAWLIESVLISSGNNSASLSAITNSPSLFPFNIMLSTSRKLDQCNKLEIFRNGPDEEMITLRKR